MEQEKAAIARQRHGKYVSAATNQHATIKELLGVVWCAVVVVICRVCKLVRLLYALTREDVT
jgi:hypothetical protein